MNFKNKAKKALTYLIAVYVYLFKSKKPYYLIANHDSIKYKIFQFRYAIYHREFFREVIGKDNKQKMISDAQDHQDNVTLYYLEHNEKILATLRVTIWQPNQLNYRTLKEYDLEKFPWIHQYTIAELSRLMFVKSQRHTDNTLKFLSSIVKNLAEKLHVRIILMSCKPYLASHYLFLGFLPYTKKMIEYPDGFQIPMIKLIDKNFLKSMHLSSQFLFSNECKINKENINQFLATYDKSIITNENEILGLINHLRKTNQLTFELPIQDVFKSLISSECYILYTDNFTKLIHVNTLDKPMYLLISGKIIVEKKDKNPISLIPGCLVGEFSYFLSNHRRTASVYTEKSILFVIKESAVNSLAKNQKFLYSNFLEFVIQNIIYKNLYF